MSKLIESLRRSLRARLGQRSGLYAAGARVVDCAAVLTSEGVGVWRSLRAIEQGQQGGRPVDLKLRSLQHPIMARPGTADARTLIDNVVRQEYGQFTDMMPEPQWMIDGGAYIGDTAAYFLSRFPKLRVIAVEPSPESYEVARRNLEPYGQRAELLRKGLYSKAGMYSFSGHQTGVALMRDAEQNRTAATECVTVPGLLDAYGIGRLDILKLDIEGAEEAIFSTETEWLSRVRLLLLEVHGARLERLLRPTLKGSGFAIREHRSVWYCERAR